MSSFARKVKRNQQRALILATARANGCTCDPDITLPALEPGTVRVATVAHDNDCPHFRDPPMPPGLKEKINSGAFDADPDAAYRIEYPSGAQLELVGELHCAPVGDAGLTPGIVRADDDVMLLDPRAVIRRAGEVVYQPRQFPLDLFAPEMRDWLIANPQWPTLGSS